ncbi:hypothetical protein JHK87_050668 [Glycine soja]|nr:hypothetical protein JHK87_050668 [Glycine soja]
MAEEFQGAIYGESWWNIINPTRSVFPLMPSTCSVAAADAGNYNTWQRYLVFVDLKGTRSCAEETNISLVSSDTSLSFLDAGKPHQSGTGSIFIDFTLQMMGFGMSSSTSPNWSQSLLGSSFDFVLQEEAGIGGGGSSNDSQIQKDWSPKNFSSGGGSQQVSTVDAFKPMNQEFSLDQQRGFLRAVLCRICQMVTQRLGRDDDMVAILSPSHKVGPQHIMKWLLGLDMLVGED